MNIHLINVLPQERSTYSQTNQHRDSYQKCGKFAEVVIMDVSIPQNKY